MTTIYQLVRQQGEYEDRAEAVLATYADRRLARAHQVWCEQELERLRPVLYRHQDRLRDSQEWVRFRGRSQADPTLADQYGFDPYALYHIRAYRVLQRVAGWTKRTGASA